VDAVGGLLRVFRFQADNVVAVVPDRARHVFQRLPASKPHLGDLAGLHAFDQELCFDESQRTNFTGNIKVNVYCRIILFFDNFIHCIYLLRFGLITKV